MENCGCEMVLKNVKDHKDGVTWRYRKTRNISMVNGNYKIKDVKVSMHHNTWLQDSNLSLELITEMVYLLSQHLSNSTIEHKLNISHQTIIEWSAVYGMYVTIQLCKKVNKLVDLVYMLRLVRVNLGKGNITEEKGLKGNGYLAVEKPMTSQRFSWYP